MGAIGPVVARYCQTHLGIGEHAVLSADDLTQEVLVAVVTALHRYRRGDGTFLAFVYGIAAHKIADARRALSSSRCFACVDLPDQQGREIGPEEHALADADRVSVRRVLLGLPRRQREVLVLRTMLGCSIDETALVVGCSAGAVRIAQHRALSALREQLTASCCSGEVA